MVNRMKRRCNYTQLIHYDYSCDFGYDAEGDKRLHLPSYNVRLYYGDSMIAEVCYLLDDRFSLEISQERSEAMESILDETLIGLIGASGVTPLINYFITNKKVSYINLRESELRGKFTSLN